MEMRKKKLPIGIENLEKLCSDDFYYIDKTGLIRELLNNWGEVNLFTRPRRFGKSLNMSMLEHFFSLDGDKSIFEGLKISKETALCEEYMGKYPVITLSFKDVEGENFTEATDMLCEIISEEAGRFVWLMDSPHISEYDKCKLDDILSNHFETKSSICVSLKLLSKLLSTHYGKQVVILLDEYDVPLDKAYQYGYYPQMVQMMRLLFSHTLKTNHNIFLAVITGCLRIAKESIFTGLNNFKVRTISDVDYGEYFGFTDKEVIEMLRYYGIEETFERIKEWYDGYHFGNVDVYCPWDVINQCDKLREDIHAPMEAHWENSSSNAIIQDILENASATVRNQIEALISGEYIEKALIPELTYTDLGSEDLETRQTYLWSVLFTTGYLTETGRPENGLHKLVIPNREVRGIYEKKINSWFRVKVIGNTKRWKEFCKAIKSGDAQGVQRIFSEIMSESISIRDTAVKKEMKENFYHGMLLGLLQAEGGWSVKSNSESGTGYTDICIEIPHEKIGCVIEVKYAENARYAAACKEAMKQIDNGGYTEILRTSGMKVIHKYGIACYKKSCEIAYDMEKDE